MKIIITTAAAAIAIIETEERLFEENWAYPMHWWPTQHDIITDVYRIKGKYGWSKLGINW